MNLLALDVATHTGWATKTAFGTWDLTPKRDESTSMRLIRFKARLKELVELEKIDCVVYERVAGQHVNAVIVAGELTGVLKLVCEELQIPLRSYSAGEIKKFATGKGNANKEKMIDAAILKLGYMGKDDNEVDALWLYQLAMHDLKL
jgi:Holliday junction resolvasome RuvABC endonuclease subunit